MECCLVLQNWNSGAMSCLALLNLECWNLLHHMHHYQPIVATGRKSLLDYYFASNRQRCNRDWYAEPWFPGYKHWRCSIAVSQCNLLQILQSIAGIRQVAPPVKLFSSSKLPILSLSLVKEMGVANSSKLSHRRWYLHVDDPLNIRRAAIVNVVICRH